MRKDVSCASGFRGLICLLLLLFSLCIAPKLAESVQDVFEKC